MGGAAAQTKLIAMELVAEVPVGMGQGAMPIRDSQLAAAALLAAMAPLAAAMADLAEAEAATMVPGAAEDMQAALAVRTGPIILAILAEAAEAHTTQAQTRRALRLTTQATDMSR